MLVIIRLFGGGGDPLNARIVATNGHGRAAIIEVPAERIALSVEGGSFPANHTPTNLCQ